jgi:kinesin family protein 6/9
MVKSAVKVIVRTRPTSNFASKNIDINTDTSMIDVHIPKD